MAIRHLDCVPIFCPLLTQKSHPHRAHTHLVLEQESSKRPDGCKHKVQFVDLLGSVRWDVLRSEQRLQQVAQGLDHAHLLQGKKGEALF